MIGWQEVLYETFPLTGFLADLLRLSNLDPKFILWTLFLGFHRRVGHRDSGFWPKPLNSVIYEIARAGRALLGSSPSSKFQFFSFPALFLFWFGAHLGERWPVLAEYLYYSSRESESHQWVACSSYKAGAFVVGDLDVYIGPKVLGGRVGVRS